MLIDLSHATIEKAEILTNGIWKIVLKTQELSEENGIALMRAMRESKQVDTKINSRVEGKTPSQRLKAVIFKDWELNHEKKGDFEARYLAMMEEIITHFKSKLPES